MKKKLIAGFISASLLLNSSFAFSDLTTEHWAYDVVHKMQGKGIISGFLDNTFLPESSVTRGQFATMLVKTLNLPIRTEPAFFEDLDDHWAKPYAESVSEYVHGKMIGQRSCFLPEDPAIREDVAMTVVKAKGLENKGYNVSTLDMFIDKNSISVDAQKYVAIAVENGIMKGNIDKTFNPKGKITRAEITALMYNLLQMPSEPITQPQQPVTPPTPVKQPETTLDEVGSVVFNEKYINKDRKYAEIVLTSASSGIVDIQLTGYDEVSGKFGLYQPIIFNGNEGKFVLDGSEKLKIILSKNVVKLVALDESYRIFEGNYFIDVGETSVFDPWNSTYFIGSRPMVSSSDPSFVDVVYKAIGFNMVGREVSFNASAIVAGNVTSCAGKVVLNGNRAVYAAGSDSIVFSVDQNGDLTVGVSGNQYRDLAGVYLKKAVVDKLEKCKNIVESTSVPYGTIMFRG